MKRRLGSGYVYKDLFWCLRALNSKVTNPTRPDFELVRNCMPFLVTSKVDEDPIKIERANLETPSSHYKSKGIF